METSPADTEASVRDAVVEEARKRVLEIRQSLASAQTMVASRSGAPPTVYAEKYAEDVGFLLGIMDSILIIGEPAPDAAPAPVEDVPSDGSPAAPLDEVDTAVETPAGKAEGRKRR